MSPFFANYGFNPVGPADAIPTGAAKRVVQAAINVADKLKSIHTALRQQLLFAQEQQQKFYDRHRSAPPEYKRDDLVWLGARNIKLRRPCPGLSEKFIGPYRVAERISSHAYRLDLPKWYLIHNVFHVSLLEPYIPNAIDGRNQPAPPPVEIDGDEEWEVDTILDSKIDHRYSKPLRYLVKWTGYEETWEPASALENASDLVAEFHA